MTDSNIDIWRSAKKLFKTHGENAAIHAGMKTDKLMTNGDVGGAAAVWKRVVRAINDIARSDVPTSASRH